MIPPFLPYAPFLFRFLCLLRLPFFKFFLPLWAFFPALPVSYSPTPGLCGSPSCRNGASLSAVSVLPVPPPHSRPTVLNSSPPLPAHLLPVLRLWMRWPLHGSSPSSPAVRSPDLFPRTAAPLPKSILLKLHFCNNSV